MKNDPYFPKGIFYITDDKIRNELMDPYKIGEPFILPEGIKWEDIIVQVDETNESRPY